MMISRRNFLAVAGAAAAAAALTACGGSSASTAASSAAGSTAGSAAASGSTIKVGVMGPLTGDASVYGKPVHEAGQCRWRCQRQAAGDHHHGRAGR